MDNKDILNVALAQIAPVWLDKTKTIKKIKSYISDAGKKDADLVVFGEGLLPGYPFWLSITNGSAFDSKVQKRNSCSLYSKFSANRIW
jgi:nitrilase